MTSAKDVIIGRIRTAVQASPPAEITPHRYREQAALDIEVFKERLQDYGVGVHPCPANSVTEAVRTVLANAGKKTLFIPPGIPEELLPDGFIFQTDDGTSYDELDHAKGVLTTCSVAVAETATIFLSHGPGEGRRALTLIPDYHLCIVYTSQVVMTVPEGIRIAARLSPTAMTTISGPSATSDIEMTRVKGVHGPRTLDVILVSD